MILEQVRGFPVRSVFQTLKRPVLIECAVGQHSSMSLKKETKICSRDVIVLCFMIKVQRLEPGGACWQVARTEGLTLVSAQLWADGLAPRQWSPPARA